MKPLLHTPRTIPVGVIALYIFCAAVIARSLISTATELPAMFPWFFGLELAFVVLFALFMWRPDLPVGLLHANFAFQSVIILILVSLTPHFDFMTALFVLLSYQVALVLPGRSRWIWIGIFVVLTFGSLIAWLGLLRGLALSMTPVAGCVAFLVYVIANREEELARLRSQAILGELEQKHHQLELRAGQVEQIAAIEERNRLARELHDSVSQTMFSIILNTRASQILLERDPARLRPQLEQLQTLTGDALAEMRSLIAQLRPHNE